MSKKPGAVHPDLPFIARVESAHLEHRVAPLWAPASMKMHRTSWVGAKSSLRNHQSQATRGRRGRPSWDLPLGIIHQASQQLPSATRPCVASRSACSDRVAWPLRKSPWRSDRRSRESLRHGVRGDVAGHVGCNDDESAFAGFVRAGGNEHELCTSDVSSSDGKGFGYRPCGGRAFKPGSSTPESRRGLPLGWVQNDSAAAGLSLDGGCQTREMRTVAFLAGRAGLEPATSSLVGRALYPLSYRPSRRRGSRRQGRRPPTLCQVISLSC